MIQKADARALAAALHERYEPERAVTIVGRLMLKALFAGRSGDVVLWALVNAHYCGMDLSDTLEMQLADLTQFISPDPTQLN